MPEKGEYAFVPYYIKTSAYSLAKKLYPNSKNAIHRIEELLRDMQKTLIDVSQKNQKLTHTILDDSYYDKDTDTYIIKINANTAKYNIYTTCMSVPKEINQKIVSLKDNQAKLKALISFLLSNKKLENGMKFDTICSKLNIIEKTAKSKFKKQILDNSEMLKKDFKILFEFDKIYLVTSDVQFYTALSEKAQISFKKAEQDKLYNEKLADIMSHRNENILIYKYKTENGVEIKVKFHNEKLSKFKDDIFIEYLNENEVRNLVAFFLK